jgi:TetR/AcrR family transcriptional regulator, transcriptional repressor for nem operon
MVRYDREHKRRTRASIVEAASQAFRAQGIEQVGVGDVMAHAGLTHGGFYAHFASKDELVAEACASSLLEAAGRSFESQDGTAPKRTLSEYLRSYLSRSHRDVPETGCAIAALAGDIARRSPETRHPFTQAAQTYVDSVATLLPDGMDRDAAWALLAGMAGTLMLARAVDDPALSDRILLSGRRLYERSLGADVETVPTEGNQ